jgi:NADPH-dependent curcumin reductase
MPVPEDSQLLIRSVYLSLDPAMRGWLIDRPSYVPPVQIGEIMRGLALGIVEKSTHPQFAAGDRVQGMFGWQEYLLSNGEAVTKLPESELPLRLRVLVDSVAASPCSSSVGDAQTRHGHARFHRT